MPLSKIFFFKMILTLINLFKYTNCSVIPNHYNTNNNQNNQTVFSKEINGCTYFYHNNITLPQPYIIIPYYCYTNHWYYFCQHEEHYYYINNNPNASPSNCVSKETQTISNKRSNNYTQTENAENPDKSQQISNRNSNELKLSISYSEKLKAKGSTDVQKISKESAVEENQKSQEKEILIKNNKNFFNNLNSEEKDSIIKERKQCEHPENKNKEKEEVILEKEKLKRGDWFTVKRKGNKKLNVFNEKLDKLPEKYIHSIENNRKIIENKSLIKEKDQQKIKTPVKKNESCKIQIENVDKKEIKTGNVHKKEKKICGSNIDKRKSSDFSEVEDKKEKNIESSTDTIKQLNEIAEKKVDSINIKKRSKIKEEGKNIKIKKLNEHPKNEKIHSEKYFNITKEMLKDKNYLRKYKIKVENDSLVKMDDLGDKENYSKISFKKFYIIVLLSKIDFNIPDEEKIEFIYLIMYLYITDDESAFFDLEFIKCLYENIFLIMKKDKLSLKYFKIIFKWRLKGLSFKEKPYITHFYNHTGNKYGCFFEHYRAFYLEIKKIDKKKIHSIDHMMYCFEVNYDSIKEFFTIFFCVQVEFLRNIKKDNIKLQE